MSEQAAMVQDRFCGSCDTRNPADAAFCVECGASLTGSPRQAVAALPRQARRRCQVCGVANPAHAIYCVNCGMLIEAGAAPTYAAPTLAPAMAIGVSGGTIVQHIYVSAAPAPTELPIGLRALWFLFVGLWAGQVWLILAWLLNLTLIGLPVGMWMLSLMPQVMTLRSTRRTLRIPPDRSAAPFAVRALYFVLIGWWASMLWLMFGWLAAATVLGLPIAFMMFERANTVMTLAEG